MVQHLACYRNTYLPLKDFIDENSAEVEIGVIQSRYPAELLKCLDFANTGERIYQCNEDPLGRKVFYPE